MIEKTIQDYYEQIYQEFPDVPKSDIKKILTFGWKSFYLHNVYGADVCIESKKFWLYCGKLMADSLKWHEYYRRKLAIKLRILYNRYKVPYDGYYYFALNQSQYDDYKAQQKKRGRPRKKFKFTNLYAYKCKDECNLLNSHKPALFRLARPVEAGATLFYREYETDKAELIEERSPKKLSDVLTSNYEYELLDRRIKQLRKKYGQKIIDLD